MIARLVSLVLVASAMLATARLASADVLLPGTKPLGVSVAFTMEDKGHLVAYPSECTLKDADVTLNPHLKFYQTYDVIDVAKPRDPYKFCGATTALYVLDEAVFPKIKGSEPADWRRSEWRIEALDKLAIHERAAFFASSAGIRATGYTMPPFGAISEIIPLKQVRERVTISGGKASKIEITYVYDDGAQETIPYAAGHRPQPTRKEARDWMEGLSDTPSPAGSSASDPPGAPAAKGPGASSCSGCAVPSGAPDSGFFLVIALALGLARRRV